jgi:hypothetical protein
MVDGTVTYLLTFVAGLIAGAFLLLGAGALIIQYEATHFVDGKRKP